MMINRYNYEIWFLDYQEGRLSQENMEEVRLFLTRHPDLAEELENFAPVLSADNRVIYPGKEQLKRVRYDDPACFETAAVAAMEGDLDAVEFIILEKYLVKNPDKKELIRKLERTRLKPDPEITFPAKESLKKKTGGTKIWMRLAAAAAMLLLAFSIFFSEKTEREPANKFTAETILPQQSEPTRESNETIIAVKSSTVKPEPAQRANAGTPIKKLPAPGITEQVTPDKRQPASIGMMETRSCTVNTFIPVFTDLIPVKFTEPVFFANAEIPLSDFLENKLQLLKENGPKGFFTREEFAIAGLHFFSRLPGHRLTGRKGNDGRLKSISLNTQLLAISIPVNRQL